MRRLRALLLWLFDWFRPVRLPEPYETLPGPDADAEMLRRDWRAIGDDMRTVLERHGSRLVQGPPCRRCLGTEWYHSCSTSAYRDHLYCATCQAVRIVEHGKEAATETQATQN